MLVETDCATIVKWIQADVEEQFLSANLIASCRELLSKQWSVSLEHVFREGNYVVDALAHEAMSHASS